MGATLSRGFQQTGVKISIYDSQVILHDKQLAAMGDTSAQDLSLTPC
jgi:hypothetical protein